MQRTLVALALTLCACGGPAKNKVAPPPLVAETPALASPEDPEVVSLTGDLGNELLPAGGAREVIARLRVSARDTDSSSRPPLNLALVIDTSGSMEGEAIDGARAAALAMIDALAIGDTVSVVVFHSQTEVLVPSTKLTADGRDDIAARVETMEARGTTDLTGGLSVGLQQAVAGARPDGISRIVLLSDGVPNDPTQMTRLAQSAQSYGISITALGLGLDYDETLLANLAQTSGGTFHYIDDPAKVAGVFADEVLRLERSVARNATLTILPGPGVTIAEVVGQQAQPTGGRALLVQLGELSEGDERELVLRMNVTGRRAGAAIELCDAVLRFEDTLVGAGPLERRVFLAVRSSADAAEIEAGRNRDVERALERVRAAATTVQAIALARSGQVVEGQKLLDAAAPVTHRAAKRYSDPMLANEADAMVELRAALPSLAPSPTATTPAPTTTGSGSLGGAPAVIRSSHDRAMTTLQGR